MAWGDWRVSSSYIRNNNLFVPGGRKLDQAGPSFFLKRHRGDNPEVPLFYPDAPNSAP
jgi:hypothetical protein